jgi:predicted O-linked N-acetylglucosamine transferase (SPINDLY family)
MTTIATLLEHAARTTQAGRWAEAELLYRHVLHLNPNHEQARFGLAIAQKRSGKLAEAANSYQQLIAHRPEHAEAHNNLGNIFLEQNQIEQALAEFDKTLELNPGHAQAYNNRGIALKRLGRLDEAAASYRQALKLKPDFDRAHSNLGNVLQEQGHLDRAIASYRSALACNPRLGPVYLNLSTALRAQGQLEESAACARQAVQLQPNLAEGHLHLGAVLQEQGFVDEAAAAFRRALALKPDCPESYYNLGGLFAGQNQLQEAAESYRRALLIQPNMSEAHAALGKILGDQEGKTEEALACLGEALRWRPSSRARLSWATCLPVIYQSTDQMQSWRSRLKTEVSRLAEQEFIHDVTDDTAVSVFFLAYQGQNDRDIQRDIAALHRAPQLVEKGQLWSKGAKKLRVGLLSSFFRRHTIGLLMGGLVEQLSRQQFEVIVLSVGRYEDEVALFFRQHTDRFLEIPRHLPTARRLIAEQKLDLLFYPDIGMDPFTSTLAYSRLAPLQCATWGHPVTSGIGAIDYFVSSEALETEEADQHYSETLVRLRTLPIHYYRPQLSTDLNEAVACKTQTEAARKRKARQDLGLASDAHIYACPQSLFKLHPDFDELLGGILRGDAHGMLLLSWGMAPHWEQLLRQRFSNTLPDVVQRIRFLPKLTRPDFLKLLSLSDVLLDPIHFGGGNTSYEGLAMGVPIVTLPSRFLRGRITFALYHQMQMLDCVARDGPHYIDLALQFGKDTAYRDAIQRKILEANGVLYENPTGIRELEQFFLQLK